MKTTIKAAAIILAAVMLCTGAASCAKPGSGEDTTKEPSVTTERKGFEDVTDPPEESSADTSAAEDSSGQDSSAAFGQLKPPVHGSAKPTPTRDTNTHIPLTAWRTPRAATATA